MSLEIELVYKKGKQRHIFKFKPGREVSIIKKKILKDIAERELDLSLFDLPFLDRLIRGALAHARQIQREYRRRRRK